MVIGHGYGQLNRRRAALRFAPPDPGPFQTPAVGTVPAQGRDSAPNAHQATRPARVEKMLLIINHRDGVVD
jgi:hypothetical protein